LTFITVKSFWKWLCLLTDFAIESIHN